MPVILCGGSGTRLWPLSRTALPKPFLPLVSEETLFQQALARVAGDDRFAPPMVVAGAAHVGLGQLHQPAHQPPQPVRIALHIGQKARALDSGIELTLVNRTGAGQTGRNDLAVFSDEVTQCVYIFVVDFFYASDCEAAKTLALKQKRLGIALRALVFVEFLKCGHDRASYGMF